MTPTAPAPIERRTLRTLFPWGAVVAPWLVSRVIAVVTLLAAANDPVRGSRFAQLTTRWDGAFYLDIARNGYGSAHIPFPKWPFFPAFPGLIRALGEVADSKTAIFVCNELLFLVALAGVYRIARNHSTARASGYAVWALALFPASFVFSMTYPSALFLAASVWGFVFVEWRVDWAAGLLALAVALVRPNGIVVAVALVVAVWSWRRALVVAGPAVLGVVAWCVYCADRTGDPFVFLTTKARWQEITLVGMFEGHVKWSILPHLVLAGAAVAVVVMRRKRMPVSWLVFTALYLLPSVELGMVGLGRYANECFPPFVAAGEVLERWTRPARVATYVASICGLVLFAFVAGRYELVP